MPPSLSAEFFRAAAEDRGRYKKIKKPPLLESPAQSRLLADAPGNAREAPLRSRAGIPQTFWLTRERHRVAGLAKCRWRHGAFSSIDKAIRRKPWSHRARRRRATRARARRFLPAKSRRRKISQSRSPTRRLPSESKTGRERW